MPQRVVISATAEATSAESQTSTLRNSDFAAKRRKFTQQFFRASVVDVPGSDAAAFAGKTPRRRAADTGRSPGDDYDFIAQTCVFHDEA